MLSVQGIAEEKTREGEEANRVLKLKEAQYGDPLKSCRSTIPVMLNWSSTALRRTLMVAGDSSGRALRTSSKNSWLLILEDRSEWASRSE